MADSKISALPASTTPLAGTEVLPIVQSSTTKQVSVANLTAGRAISATQLTLTTGNVIVADGQGIDFSATAGTGTSELLADYEEGTWTPTLEGNDINFTSVTYDASRYGTYIKVGKLVHIQGYMRTTAVTVGAAATYVIIAGLPFTPVKGSSVCVCDTESWSVNNPSFLRVQASNTFMFVEYRATANGAYSLLTPLSVATGAASNIMFFAGTYITS
jgi:hypothetical protein